MLEAVQTNSLCSFCPPTEHKIFIQAQLRLKNVLTWRKTVQNSLMLTTWYLITVHCCITQVDSNWHKYIEAEEDCNVESNIGREICDLF